EFSKDPDAFSLVAIQQIGLPPAAASYGYIPPTSSATPATALQFLLSSQNLAVGGVIAHPTIRFSKELMTQTALMYLLVGPLRTERELS
ncbi:hypothetical protein WUBG_17253, partial [Wuchereria bancrofti]